MKLGLGISLATTGVLTAAQQMADNFKIRVVADGGVFEAKACLEAQLTILSNIA